MAFKKTVMLTHAVLKSLYFLLDYLVKSGFEVLNLLIKVFPSQIASFNLLLLVIL